MRARKNHIAVPVNLQKMMTVTAGVEANIMQSGFKLLFILHIQDLIYSEEEEEVMNSNTLQVRIVGNSDENTVLQGWS